MDSHDLSNFGLWLVPKKSQAAQYQSLINQLASTEPTQCPTTFHPHVTLLYPLPLTDNVESIVQDVRSVIFKFQQQFLNETSVLDLELADATNGERFYQSVLAPVIPISPKLATLRQLISQKFGFKDEKKPYFPHLSLLYGNLSTARRLEIAHLANSTNFPRTLEIDAIAVVDLRGAASQWKIITRIPFSTSSI